ncbi:MAG: DNA-binding protein WhiA, partial [Coriobacteriales bacterium]|nr:DNA-binding protein WhiA [Coriobacteriales bacterium]
FTAEVKDELSRMIPENLTGGQAELAALIHIQGRISGTYRLELITETAAVARTIVRLLHGIYQLKTEISTRKSPLHKTFSYQITVPAQIGLEEALIDLGIINTQGQQLGIDPRLVDRAENAAAFLRGAFLGGGFISNPQGDFHFELSCPTQALANGLVALMVSLGIPARSVSRRNAWQVYLKGAEAITDFLTLVGAHSSRLSMENVLVTKSLRNDVNRRLNAEMANQAKSIDASLEQIRAIRLLAERRGLDSLPAALRQLAELRLTHPEVSLRELGELADPPLSKSAVYHRVRRIDAIARELLQDIVSESGLQDITQEAESEDFSQESIHIAERTSEPDWASQSGP